MCKMLLNHIRPITKKISLLFNLTIISYHQKNIVSLVINNYKYPLIFYTMDTSFLLEPAFIIFIVVIMIWDAVWKLIALWKSARNNHLAWFVLIAIINTVGILPIVYIMMHRNNSTQSYQ